MHEQLDELLAARDQMESLLRTISELGSDLDLEVTLHRIVRAAMELTGAPCGALGRYGSEGTVTSFILEGLGADTARWLGDLQLGQALRIDDLVTHPHAAGLVADGPTIRAFLGVPISVREIVFGNLYLGDDQPGRVFSESEEMAARALASAAGVAIDNARLFERERTAAKWMKASREIMTALLSAEPQTQSLQLIVDRAMELSDAEHAILVVPTEPDLPPDEVDTLMVAAIAGQYNPQAIGQPIPVERSTMGGVVRSGTPLITTSFRYPIKGFTDLGERSAIVIPLCGDDTVLGVIAVARKAEKPPFEHEYLELVSDFARHAAIALTLARSREDSRELEILADRERIAHDLHDHVIQKLFAAGLDLQGTIARARSPEVVDRLTGTVDDLQATIEDIRATIFKLHTAGAAGADFRDRIQNTVAELTDDRDLTTTVEMSGALRAVTGDLADHADAVVTEAVSNAVRHAQARRLTVRILVNHQLRIEVLDNGCGIPPDNQRRSGLTNMQRRAEQIGGECRITSTPGGGTSVFWSAPLS
ncbi:histidine kinase [Mycobacterium kyorinense]|uniref:Histidine kinase n=2 Tax=Mycobacterium kyorinense TaxID=487514 RepID=A0A1A2YSZ0_9MYCO|nr:GAF domain-containing sensor histidine kinase [Mycobacterium kyorinense]OBI40362.1 histidine kinase [Mycobacterium kyorinense]